MTKVTILCREHGPFMQLPAAHMGGKGCIGCGGTAKNTKETYLRKVWSVHGSKYTYEKVVYTDIDSKITITCKYHGDFEQAAASHLAGRGCPICAGKNKTTTSFINEAKLLHGDTYDYKNVVYKTAKEFIKIGCLKHGEFLQTPDAHLHRKGCKKCAFQSKVTTEDFITKATLVHGGRYDYSLTEYVANQTKIKIICKDHGVYEQRPNGHISAASGCPHCSDHGFKLNKLGAFYIINADYFVGFGITNNLEKRIKTHGRLLKRNKINYFVKDVFYGAGVDIFRFEQMAKANFKSFILNTGIDGFKTEALPNTYLEPLLDLCRQHLTTT